MNTRSRRTLATCSDGEGSHHFFFELVCSAARSGYEQTVFSLNDQRRWHRSELTSHSENEPLFFCIWSRKNKKDKKKKKVKKRSVYRGRYKSRDAFTFGNEKHWGKKIQQVPTWTQAGRNKTDISVRNTLSQLHWLHRSVNTQYRQALIANIWWVWIYKNRTKVPPAAAPSCFVFVRAVIRCFVSNFPSVHSLTSGRWMMSEG